MARDFNQEVQNARGEFKTSKEAESMLRNLNQAAAYCTGPNSSRDHGTRIAAVEHVKKELKDQGK